MEKISFNFDEPYREAIQKIKDQEVVLPDQYYNEVPQEIRSLAFSVASIEKLSIINEIKSSLVRALEQGKTFSEWKKEIDYASLSRARLETIYRTNIQSAFGAANWDKMNADKELLPYAMYVALGDDRTRETHARLSGTIRKIDDPFWNGRRPPIDYNCRCTMVSLSAREAESMGITSDENASQLPTGVFKNNSDMNIDDYIREHKDDPNYPLMESLLKSSRQNTVENWWDSNKNQFE